MPRVALSTSKNLYELIQELEPLLRSLDFVNNMSADVVDVSMAPGILDTTIPHRLGVGPKYWIQVGRKAPGTFFELKSTDKQITIRKDNIGDTVDCKLLIFG